MYVSSLGSVKCLSMTKLTLCWQKAYSVQQFLQIFQVKQNLITKEAGTVLPEAFSSILLLLMNKLEISKTSLWRFLSWRCRYPEIMQNCENLISCAPDIRRVGMAILHNNIKGWCYYIKVQSIVNKLTKTNIGSASMKIVWRFLKNKLRIELPCDSTIHFLVSTFHPQNSKTRGARAVAQQ